MLVLIFFRLRELILSYRIHLNLLMMGLLKLLLVPLLPLRPVLLLEQVLLALIRRDRYHYH